MDARYLENKLGDRSQSPSTRTRSDSDDLLKEIAEMERKRIETMRQNMKKLKATTADDDNDDGGEDDDDSLIAAIGGGGMDVVSSNLDPAYAACKRWVCDDDYYSAWTPQWWMLGMSLGMLGMFLVPFFVRVAKKGLMKDCSSCRDKETVFIAALLVLVMGAVCGGMMYLAIYGTGVLGGVLSGLLICAVCVTFVPKSCKKANDDRSSSSSSSRRNNNRGNIIRAAPVRTPSSGSIGDGIDVTEEQAKELEMAPQAHSVPVVATVSDSMYAHAHIPQATVVRE